MPLNKAFPQNPTRVKTAEHIFLIHLRHIQHWIIPRARRIKKAGQKCW